MYNRHDTHALRIALHESALGLSSKYLSISSPIAIDLLTDSLLLYSCESVPTYNIAISSPLLLVIVNKLPADMPSLQNPSTTQCVPAMEKNRLSARW